MPLVNNSLQWSKGSQFKAAWNKHKDDPDLTSFHHSFSEQQPAVDAQLVMLAQRFIRQRDRVIGLASM
ncbi:hypothetical protein HAX54_022525 [Datura stramonium]|uniref:Uncharacterized protein n=1 Tax=Datura stramonium TaxID=4076 RepID=A0ABS8UUG2_DATST|nr:hypothetical protein [Datura stramonium]